MRTLSRILLVLGVLALAVPLADAHARGGPASSAGSAPNTPVRGSDREATGAEIAKAKAADPAVVLKDIEQSPLMILEKLNKVMMRTDGNSDQLQMDWTANGAADLSLWLGKTGIVRETMKALKKTLSIVKLKTDQQDVSFPDWVKGHSSFLSEVVSGSGSKMVALKGALNHEMKSLQVMIDTTKPIVDEFHKLMVSLEEQLDKCDGKLSGASTNYEINKALRDVGRVKRSIANLRYVIWVRRAGNAGFLNIHESAVDAHVAEIAQLRTLFQNPAIVKGVNSSWKKYVEDWLLHLEDTLEDCELLLATAQKANEPFMSEAFYKDIVTFEGLKLDQLHLPVEELFTYAAERRKVVEQTAKLSTEISTALKEAEEGREYAEDHIAEVKSKGFHHPQQVEIWIDEIQESAAPDHQLINELTQIMQGMQASDYLKVAQAVSDAHLGVGGETYRDYQKELELALGDEDELESLRKRFNAFVTAQQRALKETRREFKDWTYWSEVNLKEAEKLYQAWKNRN